MKLKISGKYLVSLLANPAAPADSKIDLAIVAAMTFGSYLLAQIIHEGLGHGGTAWLAGAKIVQITNSYMESDQTGLSSSAIRAIAAAGTLANVVVGVLALFGLRRVRKSANMRYFLWLLGHVNLFKGFGYLLLAFAPIGDWHNFVHGLSSPVTWKGGLTLLGTLTSLATFFHAAATLDEFIGKEQDRRRRAFTLTLMPYFLGGTVNVLATIAGLGGWTRFAMTAALATFGGTWLMVWIGFAVGRPRTSTPHPPMTPTRNAGWLFIGAVALVAYFFLLGPGLLR